MDDDTKQYKIQIKGVAYTFTPIPDDDFVRIQLIFNMNASLGKTIKVVTRVLKDSAGEEQWDALTDRFVEKELSVEDMILTPIKKLVERQSKDRKATGQDE